MINRTFFSLMFVMLAAFAFAGPRPSLEGFPAAPYLPVPTPEQRAERTSNVVADIAWRAEATNLLAALGCPAPTNLAARLEAIRIMRDHVKAVKKVRADAQAGDQAASTATNVYEKAKKP